MLVEYVKQIGKHLLVRKATPDPAYPDMAAIAVAVVLSDIGNQVTERRGGPAIVIHAVMPFKAAPTAINLEL